jgi:copper(I)-binding protein
MRRRRALQAGFALCASLALPSARACEFFANNLRIIHPWTRATGPDTSAVVCMKFDEVTETDRLVGVETPVAEAAELVGDLLIPKGGELILSDDGPHVRLVGLKHPLLIARVYPLKLEFEKAGAINARLTVDLLRAL